MPASIPIACSLTPDELRASRDELLPGLAAGARRRTPLPNGLRLTFDATAARLRQIHAVVVRERRCCAFLDLRPGLSPGGAWLTLDVTGPDGTAELLAELLADEAVAA
jgi:hypothetical protein